MEKNINNTIGFNIYRVQHGVVFFQFGVTTNRFILAISSCVIATFCRPLKMTKCIIELERIYGIRQGSANPKGINQYKIGDETNVNDQKSQQDLAKQFGMTQQQFNNRGEILWKM